MIVHDAKGEHTSVPFEFLSPASINGHGKPPMNANILLSALFDVAQKESQMLETRGVHIDEASPRVGAAIQVLRNETCSSDSSQCLRHNASSIDT